MKKAALGLLIIVTLWNFPVLSQYEKQPGSVQKSEELVQEWFKRLNELDGSEEALTLFVDLYEPDALQQVGPVGRQFGPVFYQDRRQIQMWGREFARTHKPIPDITYFGVRLQTVNEKTAQLVYTVQAPWDDTGAAVEFTGRYLDPESNKGFMVSGAAFFQFRNGRIWRARLYMPREEIMEITPPLKS